MYDDHWMYDNECWDEVGDFCKKLASKWRELLKMDEAALGLGLAGNGAATRRPKCPRRPSCGSELVQDANRGPPRHGLQVFARDAQAPRGRRHAQGEEGEEVNCAPESRPAYLGRALGSRTITNFGRPDPVSAQDGSGSVGGVDAHDGSPLVDAAPPRRSSAAR